MDLGKGWAVGGKKRERERKLAEPFEQLERIDWRTWLQIRRFAKGGRCLRFRPKDIAKRMSMTEAVIVERTAGMAKKQPGDSVEGIGDVDKRKVGLWRSSDADSIDVVGRIVPPLVNSLDTDEMQMLTCQSEAV